LPLIGVLCLLLPSAAAAGPGDVVNCSQPLDISNSPGYSSEDPFLLTDPAGTVHLFWAERLKGPPNAQPGTPDTLMYSRWEDGGWSEPLDIFFSPKQVFNKRINSPRAVLDKVGNIHLIWIGPDYRLFYSSSPASTASSAQSWRPQELIAQDQTGTQYSADIAYGPPDTLHILYAGGTGGGLPSDNRTNRAVVYTRSDDGGATWSDPVDIFTILDPTRGPSNIRLYADPLGPLYATWTEWDASGNGQAIYFARSPDGGHTWQPAVLLDQRVGDEYERDWTAIEKLDDGGLVTFWEGGTRAYPQAQYSYDGGNAWSQPIDTFYWLIADNGPAQFVRDSANRLHVFLMRRIREGYDDRCDALPDCGRHPSSNGIWHSVWERETRWREPQPVNFSSHSYLSAVPFGGNQVVLASFGYEEGDIFITQCSIEGAEPVAARPWPVQVAQAAPVSTSVPRTPLPTATDAATSPTPRPFQPLTVTPPSSTLDKESALVLGLAPALLVIGGILLVNQIRRGSSH
jgi:hypothetical protein